MLSPRVNTWNDHFHRDGLAKTTSKRNPHYESCSTLPAQTGDRTLNPKLYVDYPRLSENAGDSGPAQIRTAVTATRRPKDTKLPHRPAHAE